MFKDARPRFFLVVMALVCAAVALASGRQESARSGGTGAGRIYLDVVVSAKSGPPVTDLQQQDFTLLDNKAPRPITSFKQVSGREAPIEVVLVIDGVNADYQHVVFEQEQSDKFLSAEGGHLSYPTAVAVFTEQGTQVAGEFSTDGNALSSLLNQKIIGQRAIGRTAGYYGAVERWQMSVQALHQLVGSVAAQPGRKIILWVSPGWPLLSGPNTELDSKQEQQIFADVVSFSTQLQQARVTLYSVDPLGAAESPGRIDYYQEFLKGVRKASQVNLGNLGVQVLAVQSGGLAFSSNNDVADLLRKCLAESVPYYEISFDAPAGGKRDEYHQLEIRLSKPGLTARTRQGYYAQP
jgi:VWFA-related protein